MKLYQLKSITENKLETKNVQELWDQNSANVQEYVSSTRYEVRPIKDKSPVKYEAFSIMGNKRELFSSEMTSAELAKTLKPIRPNQTPDAEGFTIYTDPTSVYAFKHGGEACMLELDKNTTVQLLTGQYIIKDVDGNSFKYSVEDKSTFESTLEKV